jgi:hypothetical protein
MSVKCALLGILSEKERHSHELKSAFDDRAGEFGEPEPWPNLHDGRPARALGPRRMARRAPGEAARPQDLPGHAEGPS